MARKAKSHTVIKDPLLEPYFVTIDENCCTVNETIQKDSNHFRSKGTSAKSYDKALTFHSDLGAALFAISRNLKHDKETRGLDELLDQFKTIELNLKQFINEQVSSAV
jgi:hypothetical protein|tara:strand:- start:2 stop:325 length:324 start_codon:yes stop_codon:yes gene_type:complete